MYQYAHMCVLMCGLYVGVDSYILACHGMWSGYMESMSNGYCGFAYLRLIAFWKNLAQ